MMKFLRYVIPFILFCTSALGAAGSFTVVGSLATMQSFNTATMQLQANIETLNYYAGVPGGGNKYSFEATAATPDGNIVVAPSDNPGSCSSGCMVSQLSPAQLTDLQFGVKADNSTNDSTAVNACTTYFSNIGGGTCQIVCSPAHVNPCVTKAEGIQYHTGVTIKCGDSGPGDASTNLMVTIQAPSGVARWIIGTDGTGDSVFNYAVIGCRISGLGAGFTQGGVQVAGSDGYIVNNRFWFLGEEAILADSGSHVARIYNNLVQAALGNYLTNGSFGGVRHCGMNIQGQDARVIGNEVSVDFSGLQTVSGVGLFRTAICFGPGGAGDIYVSENNIGEFGDVGIVYDNLLEGGAYGDAGSNNYASSFAMTTNARGSYFGLTSFNANKGGTSHTCYVVTANNCPIMTVDAGASGGSPGGGKNFFGMYVAGQSTAPSAGIIDSYVTANGGTPNIYDAASLTSFNLFGANLSFKGFANQANGAIANATTGSPKLITPATGASNYCPDVQADIGSIYFVNPGGAATITVHADAATCTTAQGWDGMTLDISLGGSNVTVNDSYGTSKTFNAAAANSHRMRLQNISGTEKWGWEF